MRNDTAWYVLIGEQKYGPYKYKKMIHMLQSNQLMDFNYVWAEHLPDWTPIHELEEFSKDHFNFLIKKDPEYVSTFIERKHKRIAVSIPVIGHNSIRFFQGEVVSVSEGGCLCRLSTTALESGAQLKMQLQLSGPGEQPFNVECTVLRKNYSKQMLQENMGLYYAVKFNEVSPQALEQIRRWVEEVPLVAVAA